MGADHVRRPGADILDTVEHWLSTYIKTAQDNDLYTLTLWAVHTHLVTETYTTPRLLLDSPAPGAGKTTTLDHLNRLCYHPVQAASLSSPSMLARLLEKEPRTILVDEADRTLSPKMDGVGELLAVLNSGYRRGASRPVLVPDKEEGWVAREMSTFGPVAMAGNSPDLPDDTRSRCIRVLLLPDHEGTVEDSDWQFIEDDATAIRETVESWADDVRDEVRNMRPEYPAGLRGRNRERWAPLLKVATVAGGSWPDRCLALIAADLDDQESDREAGIQKLPRHVQLLQDIAEVWPADEQFMHTPRLVDALHNLRPDWWGALNPFSNKLTAQGMGRMLSSHFSIRSDRLTKDTDQGRRGYYLQSFLKSWQSFGVDYPSPGGVPGEPARPTQPAKPAENVVGLDNKVGLAGYPETLAGTDREPTAAPESDPLDATESETIGIITDALADAGTGGLGGGRIMRIVKDTTGDGSHVFALLDEMDQTGIIRVDEKQRYYLTNKETAA